MKTSVLDLGAHSKEILRALDENEEITLTHKGAEKGKIVPSRKPPLDSVSLALHPAIGMWADHDESVPELINRLRKPRTC